MTEEPTNAGVTAHRRIIPIPVTGNFSTNELSPIIYHPAFARLMRVKQLGLTSIAFPGAQHTRFEHSLGVAARVKLRAHRLADRGDISRKDVLLLTAVGLLHDVGHPAFSHALESYLRTGHHDLGTELIRGALASAIIACGLTPEDVVACLDGTNPLGSLVTDKALGADKHDYLERDAYHAGTTPIGCSYVEQWLRMTPQGVALDIKGIDALLILLLQYATAYRDFYLRKSTLIAQRWLQLLYRTIVYPMSDVISPIGCTDDAFLMSSFRDPKGVPFEAQYGEMDFPKTAVVVRMNSFGSREVVDGKQVAVFEDTRLVEWAAKANLQQIDQLEEALRQQLRLARHELVLVPPIERRRLELPPVRIVNGATVMELVDMEPALYQQQVDSWNNLAAVRVCVPMRLRTMYATDAKATELLQLMQHYCVQHPPEPFSPARDALTLT